MYYSGGFTGESEGVVRGEDLLPEGLRLEPVTVRGRPLATGDRVRGPTVSTPPLRKLLFSATLTSNPQKLAGLDVVNPIVYTAREAMIPFSGGGVVSDDCEGGSEDGERVGSKKREAGLLSQETRRSNLDHAGAIGDEGEGWFSTPATLVETYTVCEAQVKIWRPCGEGACFFVCVKSKKVAPRNIAIDPCGKGWSVFVVFFVPLFFCSSFSSSILDARGKECNCFFFLCS